MHGLKYWFRVSGNMNSMRLYCGEINITDMCVNFMIQTLPDLKLVGVKALWDFSDAS